MITRGRNANHLYLQVVGDGDPHSIIRPDTISPRTPTETLQQILDRDDTPTSATTLLRELSDPAARLYAAVEHYTNSLQVAAEHFVGPRSFRCSTGGRPDRPRTHQRAIVADLRAHLLALRVKR